MRKALAIALAFSLWAAVEVRGQSNPGAARAEVVTELPHAKMRAILQGMGFEFTEESTAKLSTFTFELDAYKVKLVSNFRSLLLQAAFSDKISLEKVNTWNQRSSFSRAYVNDAGNPYLESDLDVEGGVTTETVREFIKEFRGSLEHYIQFLKTDTPGPATSNSPSTSTRAAVATPPTREYRRPPSAATRVQMPYGGFAVWVDQAKWRRKEDASTPILQFENVNGEAYARVIVDRIPIPTNTLKVAFMTNIRKADPNAKEVFEEKRVVNGREVLAAQVEATVDNLPVKYFAYLYGGSTAAIQVVTYTAATTFNRDLNDSTDFLDGLEIADSEAPSANSPAERDSTQGRVTFNDGKLEVVYNTATWKQEESPDAAHFKFSDKKGDGFALVIAEKIEVPVASLPEIALANAKSADPNARIVIKERRKVNGVDVWFLRIEAVVSKIPFVYLGYYYTGKEGTAQVLTYTAASLLGEYQKDFMDFIGGFRCPACGVQ